jgi:hypothetical protein
VQYRQYGHTLITLHTHTHCSSTGFAPHLLLAPGSLFQVWHLRVVRPGYEGASTHTSEVQLAVAASSREPSGCPCALPCCPKAVAAVASAAVALLSCPCPPGAVPAAASAPVPLLSCPGGWLLPLPGCSQVAGWLAWAAEAERDWEVESRAGLLVGGGGAGCTGRGGGVLLGVGGPCGVRAWEPVSLPEASLAYAASHRWLVGPRAWPALGEPAQGGEARSQA